MADIFNMEGEVALVTGASSGFGAHFASVLALHGASVALVARRIDRLSELAESLAASYASPATGDVAAYRCDVTDTGGITALFDQIMHELGPVSILINNAGIGHSDKVADLAPEKWDEVMDTDLRAPLQFAQEAARRMMKRGVGGSIVNVASIFGQLGSKGMVAYATAKGGLIQMTRALAMEWADKGIRVNALCPGWCVTDMTRAYLELSRGATIAQDIPIGRFGKPDDLDGAMLLLASKAGRYITGQTLVADGGLSIAMRDGRRVEKPVAAVEPRLVAHGSL